MNSIISRQIIFERIDSFAGSSKGLESFLKIVKGQLNELLQTGDVFNYKNLLFELINRLPSSDGATAQLIIENLIPENKHALFIDIILEFLGDLKPYNSKDDAWKSIFIFRIINNYMGLRDGEYVKNFLVFEKSQGDVRAQGILNTLSTSFDLDTDRIAYSLGKKYQSSDLLVSCRKLRESKDLYKIASFTLLNLNLEPEFLEETLPLILEILIYIEFLNDNRITRQFNGNLLAVKERVQDINWSVARSLVYQIDKLLGLNYSQAAD